MQDVSAAFLAAMNTASYSARITLDEADVITTPAIQHFSSQGGTNSSDEAVMLGGSVSGSITVTLEKDKVSCDLDHRKMFVEIGIDLGSLTEWIPVGTYKITDVTEDDGTFILTARDALSTAFNGDYEPIEGFDFTAEGGVDSLSFLAALCRRRGVETDLSGLVGIPIKSAPEGYTEREIIGFISALHGGFAVIDRRGILNIRWYSPADITVDADLYYAGGMEKASFDFTVGWLKCYVEPLAETLTVGDAAAAQGIYFQCPWMTAERLDERWVKIEGFSYRPVPALKFFGDPRIDPGDIITLEDLSGAVHTVPVMTVRCEYDGGIISNISAQGQTETQFYEGPVTRETKRIYARIVKKEKEIDLAIGNLDGDEIISRINLTDTTALIQASSIKFEGLVTANSNFKILADGSIEAVNAMISGRIEASSGKIGGCEIIDGVLQVPFANITGVLTVKDAAGAVLLSAGNKAVTVAGWKSDSNSLYSGESFSAADCFLCTGSADKFDIAGSGLISRWMLKAGSQFGVTADGAAYMSNAHVAGEVKATSGKIAAWDIVGNKLRAGDGETIKVVAIQAPSAAEDVVFAAGGSSHNNYGDCPWRVTADGRMYSSDADISGKVDAERGSIGDWNIGDVEVVSPAGTVYSGPALYSATYYDAAYNTEVAVALTPSRVYLWGRDSTGASVEEDVSWGDILKAARS